MPNLRQYFNDIRNRKQFVLELSRAERAEEHLDTVFGKLWSVLSPLLSAGVYYLFIFVVQGGHQGTEFFLHLVAGIFIFEFVSTAGTRGSTSIVRAGALLNNTWFPRVLLPLTDILTAFRVFLPALFIYASSIKRISGLIVVATANPSLLYIPAEYVRIGISM